MIPICNAISFSLYLTFKWLFEFHEKMNLDLFGIETTIHWEGANQNLIYEL